MYCRVGKSANSTRIAMAKIKELGTPHDKRPNSRTWTRCLPEDSALSDSTCANLAKTAIADSRSDWHNECNMFECEYKPQLPEEWSDDVWIIDQCGSINKRSEYLDQMMHYTSDRDVALYGVGSYIEGGCVT